MASSIEQDLKGIRNQLEAFAKVLTAGFKALFQQLFGGSDKGPTFGKVAQPTTPNPLLKSSYTDMAIGLSGNQSSTRKPLDSIDRTQAGPQAKPGDAKKTEQDEAEQAQLTPTHTPELRL